MLGCSVTHPSAGIKPLLKVLSGDRKHTNGMNGQRIRVKVESFSGPLWPGGSLHLVVNKRYGTKSSVQWETCIHCVINFTLTAFMSDLLWIHPTSVHPSRHYLNSLIQHRVVRDQKLSQLKASCDWWLSNWLQHVVWPAAMIALSHTSVPHCDWLGFLCVLCKNSEGSIFFLRLWCATLIIYCEGNTQCDGSINPLLSCIR